MSELIRALMRPEAYDPPEAEVTLLETHISWVLLAGAHAYKIKKPVNFGFIDFSSPARRAEACATELRLNRRFNPDLYLACQPIHGPLPQAAFHGDGPVIEQAVKMRRFRQQDLLPAVLQRGGVGAAAIERLADELARVHAAAPVAPAGGPYGTPEAVQRPVLETFEALARCGVPNARLAPLRAWCADRHAALTPRFRARLEGGAVRECHGDLHLGNMVMRQGRIELFDGLEFSAALRWIDVISEIAFLAMDLRQRRAPALAMRLLNRWLEQSGQHEALDLWPWYLTYRALVRAKVAALSGPAGQASADAGVLGYLDLAATPMAAPPRALVLMHGLSGSGKSHLARELAPALGLIRLSSDIERKRLFGLWGVGWSAGGSPGAVPVSTPELYQPDVSRRLFEEVLPRLAAAALAGGCPVLIDATFLRRSHRSRMQAFAERHGVPFAIVACQASEQQLQRRLQQRDRERQQGLPVASDADASLLPAQRRELEPLSEAERRRALLHRQGESIEPLMQALSRRLGLARLPEGPAAAGAAH
ncbi:hypothetical protein EVJ50_01125 [Synechococcus sp. RSCCF101]|uniref:bifunctional aminoglycoside phosphotransferase/ATP-binding protein n=1 Tax=Synechococcus sp. RSCCF101 TaxID=2511069 RepID=UPI0012466761|nr:bifunctional aminoglycoside phosphotransferase/ATP-binding protein [Synechococcus sp. RSCCF101]QEY31060.1 hypothetical protein EVJ50_01125 [Synechococcus sp. RSCCF101]